jgi:hypothetical protein
MSRYLRRSVLLIQDRVMTFQRKTAKGIIDLVRTQCPGARVVVVGYDPSLAPEAYTEDPGGFGAEPAHLHTPISHSGR